MHRTLRHQHALGSASVIDRTTTLMLRGECTGHDTEHFAKAATYLVLCCVLVLARPSEAKGNGWEHATIPFDGLVVALDSESESIRARAAESLGFRGEARGVSVLLTLLARPDPSHQVRASAYAALGRLADQRAVPVLGACLGKEEREEIRGVCLTALAGIGGSESLALVLEALREDTNSLVRDRAVDALGAFAQPEAVRALSGLLDANNGSLRRRAVIALGRTGASEATPLLLARLRLAQGSGERMEIIQALGRLRDPLAADALLREMEAATDPLLRTRITIALGAIQAPSAYDALIGALADPLPAVQLYAIRGLQELERPEAAGHLVGLYRALSKQISDDSARAFVADAPAVLTVLSLQVETLRALIELDGPRGLPAFLYGARAIEVGRDSQVSLKLAEGFYERRRIALHGLGYTHSRDAVELLSGSDGIGDPDARLRAVAARSLAVLGTSESIDKLLPMLSDPAPEVRWTAAQGLGRLADRRAVAPLMVLLADDSSQVRKHAALGLGYLGDPKARESLLDIAHRDPVETVREAARYAAGLLNADG